MNDDLNTFTCTTCTTCEKLISIFENSQFSLWQEDMYDFKLKIDALKKEIGIDNIRERLNDMNLLRGLAQSIKLVNINSKTLELHGVKSKNDLEQFFCTFTDDSINVFREEILAIANEEKYFSKETQVKKIDGTLVDIIININFPDKIEDFKNVIVSFTDISGIKRLEREIIKSNIALNKNIDKFKNILETNKIAYVLLDENCKIKESSTIFAKIIGCRKTEDLVGLDIQTLVAKDDCQKITKSLSKIDNGIPIEDMEICIDNLIFEKRGIWISLSANSLENGNKTIFCAVKDITEKKIQEFKKYITNEKSKDKVKQNINKIRNKLQDIKERGI